MTARNDVLALAAALNEVVAWGDAAEAANVTLQQTAADREAVLASVSESLTEATYRLAERDATIAEQSEQIVALHAEIARLNALLNPFKWGDSTQRLFLGEPFTFQLPIMKEAEFYPPESQLPQSERRNVLIDRTLMMNTKLPAWRLRYPDALHWVGDVEWQNSGGVTADEVIKLLPGFQAARDFFAAEGRGVKMGGYGFPRRWAVDASAATIAAQTAIYQPILDLLDVCVVTAYPIYTDIEKSRRYVQQNIASGRQVMPGKPVYVLGWPYWHNNVGDPLRGTPVSVEWWRMFLEESRAADGVSIFLEASDPKPTTEPWWLETLAVRA